VAQRYALTTQTGSLKIGQRDPCRVGEEAAFSTVVTLGLFATIEECTLGEKTTFKTGGGITAGNDRLK